ncbi:MAG TPA: thrombospondin type 3 repeat-containing protein, partial [Candidatus Polarisedimenticolaceae bacterium]|nr:thrombospondin type 3 repeat-containing protein [Candidatus Polarisedimenticolaceae bacterium]
MSCSAWAVEGPPPPRIFAGEAVDDGAELPVTPAPGPATVIPPPAGAEVINFDDHYGPCYFEDTFHITTSYSPRGVIFEGPNAMDGGAVLHECSSFPVTGYSSPNFLAFNTGLVSGDGGFARGPETIHFDPPVRHVQINAGDAGSGLVTMQAYNAQGNLVDADSGGGSTAMSTLVVTGSGIERVVISFPGSRLVLDDLAYIFGSPDTDGDGLSDDDEAIYGTNPNDPDTDDDGLLDGFEVTYGFNPLVPGEQGLDPDGDGLTNLDEQTYHANPLDADTDDDGLGDLQEVGVSTDPRLPDTDGDGLTDGEEVNVYGSNPTVVDTDGGGVDDGNEVHRDHTDPLNPADDRRPGFGIFMENTSPGHAQVFDPQSSSIVTSISLGSGTIGDCVITPDAALAFATDFANRVWVVDMTTNPPSLAPGTNPIPISNPGEDLALSPDGRFVVVCDGSGPDPISVIDVAGRIQRSTFSIPDGCNAVDVCRDGSVLVTSYYGNTLFRLTLDASGHLSDTGERASVNGTTNVYCSPNSETGIVLNADGNSLRSFRVHGLTTVNTRSLQNPIAGAFTPDGTRFWSRNFGGVQGWDYDQHTGTLGAAPMASSSVDDGDLHSYFGMEQIAVEPLSSKVYVPREGGISVWDAHTGAAAPSLVFNSLFFHSGICFRAAGDRDGDGLIDDEEIARGTDPDDPDTDNDGLLDGFEVRNGFDPLVPGEQLQDPDGDGMTNIEEQAAGADPHDPDSDDDGLLDGAELGMGTSPTDPDSDDDGALDGADNCPIIANADQRDTIHVNGIGDVCDDPDLDRIADAQDNCPDNANPSQADGDGDGAGDACDPCPAVPSRVACLSVNQDGGSCLEATIDLNRPGTSGAITIEDDLSVVPEQLRFEVLDSACAPGDFFVFILNGYLLGNMAADPAISCGCAPTLQT